MTISRRKMLGMLGVGGATLATIPARGGNMDLMKKTKSLIETRLTREYGLRHPFVCAGMAFVGSAPLAAAVANAGAMGMLGVAPEAPPGVLNLIEQTRALIDGPFGVNFIVDTTAFGPMTTDAHIEICASAGINLVTFHWNPPMKHWVESLHASGARVWFQTGLVEQAIEAIEIGVDGIIAQGSQAGGHVRAKKRTAQTLKAIIEAVPASTLILAAGGIADGHDVAKALASGADGVWVGTRMLASVESNAHDDYKRRVIAASALGTTHTTIFGPEWPDQRIQVLRNRVVDEWAGREDRIPEPPPPPAVIGRTLLMPHTVPGGLPYEMTKFSAMLPTLDTEGDFEEMCMPAGESARKIRQIKPAAEIIDEMIEEAKRLLDHGI